MMVNLFHESTGSSNTSYPIELTAELFFADDRYFSKQDFIKYGKTLRDLEYGDLKTAITCMIEGLNMTGSTRKRTDRAGRTYIHPDFLKAKARIGVKIILEEGLEAFISDYQSGNIKVAFSLEELIAEAKKTE